MPWRNMTDNDLRSEFAHLASAEGSNIRALCRRYEISPSDSTAVVRYIEGQTEHHRKVSFMDEYKAILEEAGIEYDLRYMFD